MGWYAAWAARLPDGRAFSLIELLVVIAILSVLLAILVPSLRRARDLARQAVCQSNVRQVGLALSMYPLDHEGWYPYRSYGYTTWSIDSQARAGFSYPYSWNDARNFTDLLFPHYVGEVDVFFCPANPWICRSDPIPPPCYPPGWTWGRQWPEWIGYNYYPHWGNRSQDWTWDMTRPPRRATAGRFSTAVIYYESAAFLGNLSAMAAPHPRGPQASEINFPPPGGHDVSALLFDGSVHMVYIAYGWSAATVPSGKFLLEEME